MIKKIIPVTDPQLRIKSKPIIKIDKKVITIAKDLVDTLKEQKDPEGIGLAAPQIGKNLRIFVMEYTKDYKILINPEILSFVNKTKEKNKLLEGCLSIPNYYGPLERPNELILRYIDPNGISHTEKMKGLPAQIVQHEVDHLNGILFIDKLFEQKKSLYKLEGDEWIEVDLPHIN